MISDSLLWHLVLAFAVGSVWVTLVTVIAERFGSAAGGVIGGLPSTSAFSFFFIGINQSVNAAAQATTVFPLAFSFTCAFLLFYAFFVKRGFRVGLSVSLMLWFAISGLIVLSGLKDFTLSLIGCILISSLVYCILAEKLKLENLTGKQAHPTASQLVLRAVIAGSIVVLAVWLSQIGGPMLGGIFSAFPAIFTSTLYLTNKTNGIGFSRAITRPLMVSAVLTVIPFSITVRYAYPSLGVWLGTVCSYAVAAPFAVVSYLIINGSENDKRTTN
jgi:hypothetical protein